jgi:hypothetical protein
LETATGTAAQRPTDTCFTFANYVSLAKHGYYFDANKRIIAAVHQVSSTSYYIINLGQESNESGFNVNGYYQKFSDGRIHQWGQKANQAYTNTRAGLYYTIFSGSPYPIAFVGDMPVVKVSPASVAGDWAIGAAFTTLSLANIPDTMVTGYAQGAGVTVGLTWDAWGSWKA